MNRRLIKIVQRVLFYMIVGALAAFVTFYILCSALDAAIAQQNADERVALDQQGEKAWQNYCEAVRKGWREDDLNEAKGKCRD